MLIPPPFTVAANMNYALLLLILLPFASFSQTTSGGKVCFTAAQAAEVADSLKVLPLVRAEATQWKQASTYYQRQATGTTVALDDQRKLTGYAQADAADFRRKARRRGLLNWILIIGSAIGGGFALTR